VRACVSLYLLEATGCDDVVHPLHGEPPAELDSLHVALPRAGERGEHEAHGERIVGVAQGVDERGISGRGVGGDMKKSNYL